MAKHKQKRDPKRAVYYARRSTGKQDLSFEAQSQSAQDFAAAEGFTIVATFTETVCGSESKEDCPQLEAAIEAMDELGAGVFLVARRDRLARSTLKAAMIQQLITGMGAQVMSAGGEGNGDSPEDALMRGFIDLLAEFEVLKTRFRTRAALRVKKARGELTGTAPIGYTATEGIRTADGKRYVSPPRLVADPLEQRAVARIVELRRDGVSWGGIVDTLNGEGIATRAGTRWHTTSVRRVFAREQANGRTGEQAEA